MPVYKTAPSITYEVPQYATNAPSVDVVPKYEAPKYEVPKYEAPKMEYKAP
jgi:hypothetical protein